jgi:hypothetical protein
MSSTFKDKMAPESSNKSDFSYDGQKGVEYTFTIGKVYYRYRSICLNGYAYQLIFLSSKGDGEIGDSFYRSFTTNL